MSAYIHDKEPWMESECDTTMTPTMTDEEMSSMASSSMASDMMVYYGMNPDGTTCMVMSKTFPL